MNYSSAMSAHRGGSLTQRRANKRDATILRSPPNRDVATSDPDRHPDMPCMDAGAHQAWATPQSASCRVSGSIGHKPLPQLRREGWDK